MNDSPRLVILGYLMKSPESFRARNVVEATALSRQVVNYHLKDLVEKGILEKFDKRYQVADKEELLNTFVSTGIDRSRNVEIAMTELLDKDAVERFNNRTKMFMALKALAYPDTHLVRKATIEVLNETIETLQNGKKRINNAQMTEESARKYFNQFVGSPDVLRDIYDKIVRFTGCTRKQFIDWVEEEFGESE